MTRIVALAVLLCRWLPAIQAQPGIGQNGVVNSASQIPSTLAGGAIARGARFSIHGVRLGSPDNAVVTISQNGTTIPARLLSVRNDEIEGLMPQSAPLGDVSLVATTNGQPSKPFRLRIVESNPGLYSGNGLGWGPGRIEDIDSVGSHSANSTTNPARPGQYIRLVTTGLGNRREIGVVIGNRIAGAGRLKPMREPGQEELVVRIPAHSPEGCYVPVYLQISPRQASNVVTVAIGSHRGSCEPGPIPVVTADRVGIAVLSRTRMRTRKQEGVDSISDEALAAFATKSREPILSPLLLLPPAGTCTAYTSSFQSTTVLPNSISDALIAELGGQGLDAGERLDIALAGGTGGAAQTRTISRVPGAAGWYHARLGSGGAEENRRSLPLFLNASPHGGFDLSGSGGKDVGPFAIAIPAPSPLEWTDRDKISVVDRSRVLELHWRADSSDGMIVILATNVDQISTAIGTCLCTARAADGQIAIPPALLYNLPASMNMPGIPYDQLFVSSLPAKAQTAIHARGLTGATVLSLFADGRFVVYR